MNILLTSVGRRSYLVKYFKKAVGRHGKVHVSNSSLISAAFPEADYAVVSPMIYDEEYIPFLLKYCTDNSIRAVISLFDIDLPVLSANKERFERIGVTVVVSDRKVVERCNDKWKTFLFLRENGFQTPETYVSLREAEIAIRSNMLKLPVILKPRWGNGSLAMYTAESVQEMKIFYSIVKRDIASTYLRHEASEDKEHSVLIQEKMFGQEYGMDVFNDLSGNYIASAAKKKIAMRSGETDCAVTIQENRFQKLGMQLSRKMGHIGNLDVDIFEVDENLYILEMNARFGGGYPFSHMAGADLPQAIVDWLEGRKVDPATLEVHPGVMGQKDIRLIQLQEQ